MALSLEECFVSGHRLSLVEALMARWSSSLKQTVVMVYACSYELKPAESTHTQVNTGDRWKDHGKSLVRWDGPEVVLASSLT